MPVKMQPLGEEGEGTKGAALHDHRRSRLPSFHPTTDPAVRACTLSKTCRLARVLLWIARRSERTSEWIRGGKHWYATDDHGGWEAVKGVQTRYRALARIGCRRSLACVSVARGEREHELRGEEPRVEPAGKQQTSRQQYSSVYSARQ